MWQFVALAGAAFSAYGQMQAGKAAAQQGRLQQAMYEQERRQNEIETLQRHNDRLAAYDSARASNQAWFAFSGRDPSDRSVQAFLNKQREVAYTDVARSDAQGFAEGAQLAFQGRMARYGGETRRRAYQIQAISTLASGLHDYGSVKTT
jgi:hypothetical protein